MSEILPWIVTVVGLALIALLLSQRRSRWIGFPFVIVTAGATLAAGISPLVEKVVEVNLGGNFGHMGIPGYYSDELPGAIGLVLLSYGSLLLGMLAVYLFSRLRQGKGTKPALAEFGQWTWFGSAATDRAWKASLVLFGFGALCHVVIVSNMAQIAPVTEWPSERYALYSRIHGDLYYYAFALSPTMQIGAWGLLIFAGLGRGRLKLAVIANGLFIALQVLFGGRFSLIVSLVAVVLIWHYGVHPLRNRHWLGILVSGLVAFSLLTIMRFDIRQAQGLLPEMADALLVPRSISEAVWARRYWPDVIPFFGGESTLHEWQRMFPSARFMETRSTWDFLVSLFYGGEKPLAFRESGGIHFGFPVEQYIDLGYFGMVGVGLFYGFAIGGLFEWQARQQQNPLLVLLAVVGTTILLAALEGMIARAAAEFFFFYLLPIGFIALVAGAGVADQRWRVGLIAALYSVALCFLLRTLTGLDLFSYLLAFFLSCSYICSLFLIHVGGKPGRSETGFQKSMRFSWRRAVPLVNPQNEVLGGQQM